MSQVDVLTYSSILFWSILSLFFTYFLIFSYLLPCLITTFKVRLYLFHNLITILKKYFYFSQTLFHLYLGLTLNNIGELFNEITQNLITARFLQTFSLFLAKGYFKRTFTYLLNCKN